MATDPDREQRFTVGDCKLWVTGRSLADLGSPVDVLVSSDDNYLSHGGGVSRALWAAGGEGLIGADVSGDSASRVLGDVVVTGAGRLKAKALFHAITIDFDRSRRLTTSQLGDVIARIFTLAADQGHESIGLPLIASGAGRITPQVSATVLARATQDCLASPSALRQIVVAAPEDRFEVASTAFGPLRSWDGSFGHFRELTKAVLTSPAGFLSDQTVDGLRMVLDTAGGPDWPIGVALFLDEHVGTLGSGPADLKLATDAKLLRNALAHGSLHPRWSAAVTEMLMAILMRLEATAMKARLSAEEQDASRTASPTEFLIAMQSSRRRPLQPLHGPLFDRHPIGSPIREVRDTPRPAEPTIHGREGTHVRRLHRLLLDRFAEDGPLKNRMDRLLSGRGYQGEFELRLLEHCIRIEEPADLLSGTFDLSTLHLMYEQTVGQAASDDADANILSRGILSAIGFPVSAACHGPKQVKQVIKQAEQSVRVNGLAEASAAVQNVARQLEYLCHVLLRFICRSAFSEAPEGYLTKRESLKKPGDLGRSGLGSLLIFTEQVIDDLRNADTPKAQILRKDIGQGSLPDGKDALSRVRNSFSHFRPGAPVASERDALEFLKEADRLVDALTNGPGRLLPIVITIQSLQIDRWGRQTVHALNDEGLDEVIFTEETVIPGETYLMFPLSNPLRADPILIPAGEVVWRD